MPRDLVLGNGKILVNFDQDGIIRDFYFPHVGSENHLNGHPMRIGVLVEEELYWVDTYWDREIGYKKDTLVSDITLTREEIDLRIKIEAAVHYNKNIYLKKIKVENLKSTQREVKLYFSHDLRIYGSDIGDTVLYAPQLKGIMHYKGRRYFLMTGRCQGEALHNYSTGIKNFQGAKGTWKDAEDGELSGNPIAQGSVDSTISFKLDLAAQSSEVVHYWIAVGKNHGEIASLNDYVLERGVEKLIKETGHYWYSWVNKREYNFSGYSQSWQDLFKRSLLTVRTQIDHWGAILAANDTDILEYNRDHYSYMWPRDGALVAYYLDQAGYHQLTERFFDFCKAKLTDDGYLLHKYNPDGSLGSSWHPWVEDGQRQLPIQEDETALPIYALGNYYRQSENLEFIQEVYEPLVKKAADFMVEYRDPDLKLPQPSHDLWEERYGILTFTSATVYGALEEAANFAELFGEEEAAAKYSRAAEEIKAGILEHLYDEELGRFVRMINLEEDGKIVADKTIESSLFGVYYFGVLPADDFRVVNTMKQIEKRLWVKTEVGGVARYEDDYYFQVTGDIEDVPGNPWVICTLWLADWYIEIAKTEDELKKAQQLIDWVIDSTYSDNLLPEQLHPYKGTSLSVAPLTWSHATFAGIVLKYKQKLAEIRSYNQVVS